MEFDRPSWLPSCRVVSGPVAEHSARIAKLPSRGATSLCTNLGRVPLLIEVPEYASGMGYRDIRSFRDNGNLVDQHRLPATVLRPPCEQGLSDRLRGCRPPE